MPNQPEQPNSEWLYSLVTEYIADKSGDEWWGHDTVIDVDSFVVAVEAHVQAAYDRGFHAASTGAFRSQQAAVAEALDKLKDLMHEYHLKNPDATYEEWRAFVSGHKMAYTLRTSKPQEEESE